MEDVEFLYKEGKRIETIIDLSSADRDMAKYTDSNVYTLDIPMIRNVVGIELLQYSFPNSHYLINDRNNILNIDGIDYSIPIGNYNVEEFVNTLNETVPMNLEYVPRLSKLRLKNGPSTVTILTQSKTLSRILGLQGNSPYLWFLGTTLPHMLQMELPRLAYIGLENVVKDRNLTKFKIVLGETVITIQGQRQAQSFDHPIGKLASLSIALKNSDQTLVDTNGVDHWFTIGVSHISIDDAKLPHLFPQQLAPIEYNPQGGVYGNIGQESEDDSESDY